MIKGILSTADGGKALLVGLVDANIRYLLAGDGITIDLNEMVANAGVEHSDITKVFIIWGPDEEVLTGQLNEAIPGSMDDAKERGKFIDRRAFRGQNGRD